MAIAFLHPVATRSRRPTNTGVGATTEYARAGVAASMVVRRVKLPPVAAFALSFLLGLAVLTVAAAVVTWAILERLGSIDYVERLMLDVGFENFRIDGQPLLRLLALGAGAAVVVGTLLVVLATVVFNLVNRLVGGLSLEVVLRPRPDGTTPEGVTQLLHRRDGAVTGPSDAG